MINDDSERSAEQPRRDEDGLSFLDILLVLAKRKLAIIRIVVGVPALSLLVSFFIPNMYTGTATIMPPQEDQSTAAAILGQLGGLGGAVAGTAFGLKNPNDLYVGVLQSRTIADQIILRFELQKVYDKDTLVDTREKLDDRTSINAGKDGLIRVEVLDRDPRRAADMANAYIDALEKLTERIAVTEASKRRLFYEKQLKVEKSLLANAEIALVKSQKDSGLIKLDDQARAIFEAVAALRAQIAAKEIQLSAMKSFATERNSAYILAKEELTGLKAYLHQLESDKKLGDGDILVPTSKIPEAGLEYLRRYRDLRYHEAVFEALGKQFEQAKVEEGRNATLIQVVDRAVVMDDKTKPDRLLIGWLSFALGLLLALLWAFYCEVLERVKANPAEARRFEQLRSYIGF